MAYTTSHAFQNKLLRALSLHGALPHKRHLEDRELTLRHVCMEIGKPVRHVWFVESGVISIVGALQDGTAVEVATVGNEGFVGLPAFLGVPRAAAQAFVQVQGRGYRMAARHFRSLLEKADARAIFNRYTQALFTQIAQGVACNRSHAVDERCARWLLMTHDRVGGDTFPLTQAFLAQMLGVRRASVNGVATSLQQRGVIRYVRGKITVADRTGLEDAACECYGIIRDAYAWLVDGRREVAPRPIAKTSKRGKSTLRPPRPAD